MAGDEQRKIVAPHLMLAELARDPESFDKWLEENLLTRALAHLVGRSDESSVFLRALASGVLRVALEDSTGDALEIDANGAVGVTGAVEVHAFYAGSAPDHQGTIDESVTAYHDFGSAANRRVAYQFAPINDGTGVYFFDSDSAGGMTRQLFAPRDDLITVAYCTGRYLDVYASLTSTGKVFFMAWDL